MLTVLEPFSCAEPQINELAQAVLRSMAPHVGSVQGDPRASERLTELFRSLRETHGGPAYISQQQLKMIQQGANDLLHTSDESEEAYRAACMWTMRQLRDPLSCYLSPEQAVAARERFHGRISLGFKLHSRFVRKRMINTPTASGRWHDRFCALVRGWRQAAVDSLVEEGSVAARAGLRVGDEVLDVNGIGLFGTARSHALELIDEGPEGERVSVTLRRKHDRLETVRLTRSAVPLRTVSCHSVTSGDIANGRAHIIRISSFSSTTAKELLVALRDLRRAGAMDATFVFDLRGNEGGLLPEAIKACRMLLPRGAHILSLCKSSPPRVVRSFHRRWYHRGLLGFTSRHPCFVLVDRASASSAEVFAGALASSGGAVIIGQRTYGKGSSQAVVYQSDGCAISFTAYTLFVGCKGGPRFALSEGVLPDLRWRWPSQVGVADVVRQVVSARRKAEFGSGWHRLRRTTTATRFTQ